MSNMSGTCLSVLSTVLFTGELEVYFRKTDNASPSCRFRGVPVIFLITHTPDTSRARSLACSLALHTSTRRRLSTHEHTETMPKSLYEKLGVDRDSTQAEIRKAYRKQALLNHPDKNPGEEARARFLEVAEAYSVLSEPAKRAKYDQGGALYDQVGFDFGRASDLFNATFGRQLMEQWRPGLTVSGILVSDGKRISITIHPDGTTEEQEHGADGRAGYFSTTTVMPGGGRLYNIQLTGSMGSNLAALLVPDSVASLRVVGPVVTTVVSWVPSAIMGYLALSLAGLTGYRGWQKHGFHI